MPAIAQDQETAHEPLGGHSAQADSAEMGRATRRAERAERAERTEARRVERPQQVEQRAQHSDAHVDVMGPNHSDSQSGSGHGAFHRDARREHRDLHATDPSRREHREFHRDQKRDHRSEHRSWGRDSRRGGHGDYHRDVNREHRELHASDPTKREHRNWHRDVTRQHDRRHAAWDSSWRRDRSYDWRRYRSRYNSVYDLSNYYDPYRSHYRRFSIGFSLWPSYYSSRYWLHDPWQYRLPPAYGPYRWVRYYDDALLVNIYTGRVVDVEYGFFW
jgi:hypothetical protein